MSSGRKKYSREPVSEVNSYLLPIQTLEKSTGGDIWNWKKGASWLDMHWALSLAEGEWKHFAHLQNISSTEFQLLLAGL